MGKVRCYTYTRVSTAMQVDGYSLNAQRDKLHKYAEYQGMQIIEEFTDEGRSGKNVVGRLAFQEMLSKLKAVKIMYHMCLYLSCPDSGVMQLTYLTAYS